MSLSIPELADVVTELTSCLVPGRLSKLNAPHPNVCQLRFRCPDTERILLIDLTPGSTRLHLLSSRKKALPSPPSWVMKGRREIEGLHLTDLQQVANDRVVRLVFAGGQRPGRVLIAAMFDRVGRLSLLDQEDRIVHSLVGEGGKGDAFVVPEITGTAPRHSSRFPPADPHSLAANLAVEQHYENSVRDLGLEERRRDLARLLARERKKLARRLAKMEIDHRKTNEANDLSRQGEALKVNLKLVQKGLERISLQDPFDLDGEKLVVKLDPRLTAVDNMQRLFTRARRLAAARPVILERMEANRASQAELERFTTMLAEASCDEEFDKLAGQLTRAGFKPAPKPATKRTGQRQAYRSHLASSGRQILVGRSARDNHELSFRIARGSDLWLHASGRPGAHVIVRLARNEEIDEQTLLDAATLAAHASGGKAGDKLEVTYTRAKNVHPVKGAHPGLASVARARTILVRIEADRLQRLRESVESL